MIDLIKIIREKALNEILYANARLSVCEELIQMCEERKSEESCQNPDTEEKAEDVVETATEENPQENLTSFNF